MFYGSKLFGSSEKVKKLHRWDELEYVKKMSAIWRVRSNLSHGEVGDPVRWFDNVLTDTMSELVKMSEKFVRDKYPGHLLIRWRVLHKKYSCSQSHKFGRQAKWKWRWLFWLIPWMLLYGYFWLQKRRCTLYLDTLPTCWMLLSHVRKFYNALETCKVDVL